MTKTNKYKLLVGLSLKKRIAIQQKILTEEQVPKKKRKRGTKPVTTNEEPTPKKLLIEKNKIKLAKAKTGREIENVMLAAKDKDNVKKKRVHRGCFKKAENKKHRPKKRKVKKVAKDDCEEGESSTNPSLKSGSNLRDRLLHKMKASKFRHINEKLYTQSGHEAKEMFDEDPDLFIKYHEGFTKQSACWPINPLDVIIKDLKKCKDKLVIADMGCGEARLADSLLQHKFNSFDLVAINPNVTACDMSKTPLKENAVDVVVFCLSLMGTNLCDYLKEANRILKDNGILKIAEIINRIPNVLKFQRTMAKLGFVLINERQLNDMFIIYDYEKKGQSKSITNTEGLNLQPCLYKKR